MASSNMISLIFIISTIIIGFINCVEIEFGQIQHHRYGESELQWKHDIAFPLKAGDKHYFFALTNRTNWFIRELAENGSSALETSRGKWNNTYERVFPFTIDHKQFIFGISDQKYWFIREILPGGLMGNTETANGYWKSIPTVIFPFHIGGKHHVFSLTGTNWFIKELLPNGKIGSETDSGSWKFKCSLGFAFWIKGRQYLYGLSQRYWFIRELLYGGKMGNQTADGHWASSHQFYAPFGIDDKYYFYAASGIRDNSTSWFVQELLGNKMGTEKAKGSWPFRGTLLFTFNIDGRPFFYGERVRYYIFEKKETEAYYNWFVQEIIQKPRLPIIDLATSKKNYCDVKKVSRSKRQNNSTTINTAEVIRAIEEYFFALENDVTNTYQGLTYNLPRQPITSVVTFRAFADANHNSSIDLTALIRAEIHQHHMPPQRDSIPQEVHEHLRQMDRANDDEAGHLLASSLGGPNVPFNFAPQSPTVNREVRISGSTIPTPGWYAVEEMLRDYLIESPVGAYIRWALAPIYSLLENVNSRRPTTFLMTVRFYDAQNNLVNWRGEGALRYYNFLNAPTEACRNPSTHPWWSWSQ